MSQRKGRFGFEDLDVWNQAIDLADLVYKATRHFPADERFGLTNQVRRASVSVAGNIAEGSGRGSPKDSSRFIEISFGSLMEIVSHSTIAIRQGFLSDSEFVDIHERAERISRTLSGLRNSLTGP